MENNNKKKKTVVFTAIAILTLIVFTVGITYAYFNVNSLGNNASVDINVITANKRDVFSTSGTPIISLDITNDLMQEANGKNDYSSFLRDDGSFVVSLEAGSSKATCSYDIAITSNGDDYTKSTAASNLLEYTIQGTDGIQKINEINIDSALSKTNGILGHFTISDSYDEETQMPTIQEWNILSKFYNLDVEQKEQLNKHFSFDIKVVNVNCNNKTNEIVSILGDSISTLKGYIPSENRARYVQTDAEATGGLIQIDYEDTWWGSFINSNGYKLGINESWAGSTVSNSSNTNSGDIGPDRAMASMTRINKLDDNGTPDIILFFGGTNDIGRNVAMGTFNSSLTLNKTQTTFSNFAEAYHQTLLRLKDTYPNAQIIAILPTITTSYYTEEKLNSYDDLMIQICNSLDVTYVDMRKAGLITSDLASDGIHPLESGMKKIVDYLKKILNNSGQLEEDVYIPSSSEMYVAAKPTSTNGKVVNKINKGWAYTDSTNDLFINKAINYIEFYTNQQIVNGDVTVSVLDKNGEELIDFATGTYTNSLSSANKVGVKLSKDLVIKEGQYLAFFTQDSTNFSFLYLDEGEDANSFLCRIPTGNDNGEAWSPVDTRYDLNIGVGYVIEDIEPQTTTATWYFIDEPKPTLKTVNKAGRGWAYTDSTNDLFINKPVNVIEFTTNTPITNGDVTLSIVSQESEEIIDSTVAKYTKSGNTTERITIVFPKSLTIQEGQYLAFFTQNSTNFDFLYGTSSSDSFYSRLPKVYGTGTKWSNASGYNLGISVGYLNN